MAEQSKNGECENCVTDEDEESLDKQQEPIEQRGCGEGALEEPLGESQRISDEVMTEECLLRSTICELENGLQESRKLLAQRDEEIRTLRIELEKLRSGDDVVEDERNIEVNLQEAQQRVFELESKVDHMREEIKNFQNQREKEAENGGCDGKQTCYCGSVCGAMKEVSDLKRKLHVTEQKYIYLKRNIRNNRNKVKVGVAQRDSACVIS